MFDSNVCVGKYNKHYNVVFILASTFGKMACKDGQYVYVGMCILTHAEACVIWWHTVSTNRRAETMVGGLPRAWDFVELKFWFMMLTFMIFVENSWNLCNWDMGCRDGNAETQFPPSRRIILFCAGGEFTKWWVQIFHKKCGRKSIFLILIPIRFWIYFLLEM